MSEFKEFENPWSADNSEWFNEEQNKWFDGGEFTEWLREVPEDRNSDALFTKLWKNYPSKNIKHLNDEGKDEFRDHCSINVSHTFIKSGINLRNFKGVKCYYKCPLGTNRHSLRAQELADWLITRPFKECPKPKQYSGEKFEEGIKSKKGIVFFKNYWQRDYETGNTRTGDHIDLWDRNKLASIGLIATWVRTTFPTFSEEWLDMSDLRKSEIVLFWEIE